MASEAPPRRSIADRFFGRPLEAPEQPPSSYSTTATISALTASAKVVAPAGEGDKSPDAKVRREEWQSQAWNFYDLVGELHYSANFIGACLSRVILRAAVLGDDGKPTPVYGDEIMGPDPEGGPDEVGTGEFEKIHALADEATAAITALRSPIGGQAQILRSCGVNLTVAGECYLLGTDEQPGRRKWEILSTEEIKVEGKVEKRIRGEQQTGGGEPIPSDRYLVRIWRSHPRFSDRADSSIRPLLEILEELVLLTRAVRAMTTSRLAGAGVYWIPQEIDYPGDDEGPEGEPKVDKLTADLIAAMMTPISDRSSAAAVVPMIVRAKAAFIEKIRHDDFTRSFESYPSVALRDEAVKRFAQGVDLPVEIVSGQGGANHWSAWQIDESTFKAHIEPLLELIVDGLTQGYLLPYLKAQGFSDEALAGLVVHYDASELIVHPNRGADATTGVGLMLLAGRVWRRENGFSEDDAPTPEEIEEMKAIATAKAPPPMGGGGGGGAPSAPEQGQDEVAPGTPDASQLRDRMAAAAEVSVDRAVERAGARIKSKTNGQAELRATIGQASNIDVAALLGPTAVEQVIPEGVRSLFVGEFSAFSRSVLRWARDAGIPEPQQIALEASALLEDLAERRLFDPRLSIEGSVFESLLEARSTAA